MPTIHIVCGATGAGKTFQAMRFAEAVGGVRFSIDEWMTALFWMDSPDPIDFGWTMERIGRCEAMIRNQIEAIAARGVDCVLDLGFTKAEHRAAFADHARRTGAAVKLHWVDVAPETRWQRVEGRNRERGPTYAMPVTRDMFDFMETEWEPPTEDELKRLNGHIVS